MSNDILSIKNSGWLSKILDATKMNPLRATISILLINLCAAIPLALVFNAWWPTQSRRGFANDVPTWGFEFLMQPIILGAFCWIQKSTSKLFNELIIAESVIQNTSFVKNELEKTRQKFQHQRLSPLITFLAAILACIFILAFTKTIIPPPVSVWLTANPIPPIILSPLYFLTFYALFMFLYDLLITYLTLNKIVNSQKIRVEPLHPDNAGGLSSIGRFVANLGYIMGAIGATFMISALFDPNNLLNGKDYPLAIYIVLYLIFVPFIFFGLLWSTHRAMVKSRDDILIKLSKKFDLLLSEYLKAKSPKETDLIIKELQQTNEMYELAKKFQVWPFNYDSLRKYFGISLSPFLSMAIPIFEYLIKH